MALFAGRYIVTHQLCMSTAPHRWAGQEKISVATVRNAAKSVVPPDSRMCVPVKSSATNLFQIESKSLAPGLEMFHVFLGIIQPEKTNLFFDNISNLSAKPRHLPKHMVLAHGAAPPSYAVSTDTEETLWRLFRKRLTAP